MEEFVDFLLRQEPHELILHGIISIKKVDLSEISLDDDLFGIDLKYETDGILGGVSRRIFVAHRTLPGIVSSVHMPSADYLGRLSFTIHQSKQFSRACDIRPIREEFTKHTGLQLKLNPIVEYAYANLAFNWEDKYWYFIDRKGNIIKYNKHGKL